MRRAFQAALAIVTLGLRYEHLFSLSFRDKHGSEEISNF